MASTVPPRSTTGKEEHRFGTGLPHDGGRLEHRDATSDRVLGDHDLVAGLERAGDAPAAAVVLDLLAHAEAAQVAAAGGGDGRDPEGHRVGPHREATDGRDVVGQDGQRGVGDEEHPVGTAGRLLGVDEPVAVLAALQDEVAAAHAVAQQVVDERGGGGVGHR